ncbi:MAG: hypothetical protein HY680_11465 [Chloroflexi bacterium]|nr:hypothetical protein [Chloroflexota bacterium]
MQVTIARGCAVRPKAISILVAHLWAFSYNGANRSQKEMVMASLDTVHLGIAPGEAHAVVSFLLPVPEPLDLKATLESGQAFRWGEAEGWYWGVVSGQGYALRQEEGGLRVRSSAPTEKEAKEALHAFLRLEDDLEAITRDMALGDGPLSEAVSRHRGLRLLRQDPWECLVSFICSQASNIPRIGRNLRSVAEAYGESAPLEGQALRRFPKPERLAQAGEDALYRLGLGFRAGYVALAAQAVGEGRLDLAALRGLPYANAKASLMALRGVGEKVADCVLLFSLDKLEGFPLDRWVRRALADWYGQSEKARYRDVLAWAQGRWGTRCGYVQQYLFHHRRTM